MSEDKKEFVVRDRRVFSEERTEAPAADIPKEPPVAAANEGPAADADYEASPTTEPPPLPEINFSTFIFSLNSSALVHLGLLEDPGAGKRVKNLPFARQTIDILGMLEEKTRGNLAKDEESLLKNILHDLRLMYVKEKAKT